MSSKFKKKKCFLSSYAEVSVSLKSDFSVFTFHYFSLLAVLAEKFFKIIVQVYIIQEIWYTQVWCTEVRFRVNCIQNDAVEEMCPAENPASWKRKMHIHIFIPAPLIFLFIIYYAIFNLVQFIWIYITYNRRKTFNKTRLIWEEPPAGGRVHRGGGGGIGQRQG